MKLIDTVKKNLLLARGWRTRRQIVVIESDDWGAARIQDKRVFNELSARNPLLEYDLISRYDSLETNDDLEALLEVFGSVKDRNGRPAVLTADSIMANPDYDRIAASGYQQYFYEPFTRTLDRFPHSNRVEQLILQGRTAGIYHPQFHGREHVNIRQWLTALQQGNADLLDAFRHGVFGIPFRGEHKKRRNIVSALDFENPDEIRRFMLFLLMACSCLKSISDSGRLPLSPPHMSGTLTLNRLCGRVVCGICKASLTSIFLTPEEPGTKKNFITPASKITFNKRTWYAMFFLNRAWWQNGTTGWGIA